jgi:hypothetical protein
MMAFARRCRRSAFVRDGALICIVALTTASRPHLQDLSGAAPGPVLTDGARLASIYDTILAAHVDDARAQLSRSCPPAPAPACDVLRTVALWWEIQQDQWNRTLDAAFEQTSSSAIHAAAAWTEREPRSAEAWFYLAGSYAPLAQWQVVRSEKLAAARNGKRIKDALERTLSLDNRLQDAWFGIGLYHYYADVAPAALKFLRVLLLLPGGNRAQGMQEMLRAREHGELVRGEADYQMHWLYLWYEQQPDRALELLRGLDGRYPTNPVFLERLADVQHTYLHDHRASAATWQTLLDRARGARVAFAAIAERRARVGLSSELNEIGETARAIDLVGPIVVDRPSAPYGIVSAAQLALARAREHAGDRRAASSAYAAAIAEAPHDDPEGVRSAARAALARVQSAR